MATIKFNMVTMLSTDYSYSLLGCVSNRLIKFEMDEREFFMNPLHSYPAGSFAIEMKPSEISHTLVTPDFTRKTECISRVRQDHFTHT
jgi:hypothetical protein